MRQQYLTRGIRLTRAARLYLALQAPVLRELSAQVAAHRPLVLEERLAGVTRTIVARRAGQS